MKKTTLILCLFIGGLIAIVSALPLAWIGPHVVPSHMSKNARFHGTIWHGQADMPFGQSRAPVTFKASALKLVTGQSFLDFAISNLGFNLQGHAGLGSLKDVKVNVNIVQLPLRDPRIRGLKGQVIAQISKAKFGKDCKSLSGDVRTDFLQANDATWFWRGPELSGPIRCEDGAIIAEMSGNEAGQRFTASLRLNADGMYSANMQVDTNDERAAVVLGFYGFEKSGAQFVLSETGRWY